MTARGPSEHWKSIILMMLNSVDHKKILLFKMNVHFHMLIAKATRNTHLINIRNNFGHLVDGFARYPVAVPGQVEATLEEHPKIIDALRKRNPGLAEFVMREHMENCLVCTHDWKSCIRDGRSGGAGYSDGGHGRRIVHDLLSSSYPE